MRFPSVITITILIAINAIVTSGSDDAVDADVSSPHVDSNPPPLAWVGVWIPNRMELGIEPMIPYEPLGGHESCETMLKDNPGPCTWTERKKMCCGPDGGSSFLYCPFQGAKLQVGYCPIKCSSFGRRGFGDCVNK